MNNQGYNWYTPEMLSAFSKTGVEVVHVQNYLEQFILALWIPELFMTLVLIILIFTMAFWKNKSKVVFIKMIIYAYMLILFLYQHTYRNIELDYV